MPTPTAVVERYLAAIPAHDWDGLAATLAPDVLRIGPFGDVYQGVEAYLGFVADLLPTLERYDLTVTRVEPTPTGAVVELSETMLVDGALTRTDEALVFDVDGELITRIAIYIRSPQTLAPDHET